MNISKYAPSNIIPPSGIYRKITPNNIPIYKKPKFDKTKKLYITNYTKPAYYNYYTYINNKISILKFNTDGSVVIKY